MHDAAVNNKLTSWTTLIFDLRKKKIKFSIGVKFECHLCLVGALLQLEHPVLGISPKVNKESKVNK